MCVNLLHNNISKIFKDEISPDTNLIKKIAELSTPTNKKELKSFLRLANIYSRYLPKYCELIESFAELQKKQQI